MTFRKKILHIVRGIPRGSVMTYGQVAYRAGSPRAYRAVGSILKTNFDPEIPCHRVIRSDGHPGEYNGGVEKKIALLKSEGALLEI